MRALLFEQYGGPFRIASVPDPAPPVDGAVIAIRANGICRSDWHAWQGHDPIAGLPHVPGHEFAGIVVAVGKDVRRWRAGDRVTVPFSMGCGTCGECRAGHHNVCDNGYTPGFSGWGGCAEYVALPYADTNLVELPEAIGFQAAASLGCRFITAFRAVVDQGRIGIGDKIAIHGCGGLGLAIVMIAAAMGAEIVAVDIKDEALDLARSLGAQTTINAQRADDVPDAIRQATGGGVMVSIDALGSGVTLRNSILGLRKRGRHVQAGLLAGEGGKAELPVESMIGRELEFVGSRGMPAWRYDAVLGLIARGAVDPARLVDRTIPLSEAGAAFEAMGRFASRAVTVIDRFT